MKADWLALAPFQSLAMNAYEPLAFQKTYLECRPFSAIQTIGCLCAFKPMEPEKASAAIQVKSRLCSAHY